MISRPLLYILAGLLTIFTALVVIFNFGYIWPYVSAILGIVLLGYWIEESVANGVRKAVQRERKDRENL